ncbi:ABC transporter substrate-binding protein [Microlunatus endophyticus]|nr:ABC transporter substrate-binding protein [Microlunatus endophyticus]
MNRSIKIITAVAAAAAVSWAVTACGDGNNGGGTSANGQATKTLTANDTFDLKTADPARSFEFTGGTVVHQLYQTVLGFKGNSVKDLIPQLCSYTISKDNKTVTLTLDGTHHFSDGSPVTVDDIVFSFKRLQGIKGNPSFMLDGVDVEKVDDKTVKLVSKTPNPQLPYILPNTSLGIVNSKQVKAHGGTEGTDDKAEQWLDGHSEGSGPYELESYNAQSQVVFKANPHYDGPKPTYNRVVLQNVDASTQKVNVQAGTAQLAYSLGPDQVKDLDKSKASVLTDESTETIFMWFNMDPQYGKEVSNPTFIQGIRHAIDYSKLLDLAGTGAIQPGGMVPVSFLGGLKSDPANSYDLAKAKQLISQSGYSGQTISVLYSEDVSAGSAQMGDIVQSVQAQLKAVGVNLKLNPQPSSTSLDSFRSGKMQAGIAYWGADYPDPADYLVFTPDQSLAMRAQWTTARGKKDAKLAAAASAANGDAARSAAYIAMQKQMNIDGPFIPLFQPASITVAATSLKDVVPNPVLGISFGDIH